MKNIFRKTNAATMVETALTIPVFLLIIFSFFELSRALYVMNTLGIAAQKVAAKIAVKAKKTGSYDLSTFGQFADQVRFPGSVVDSTQFEFDITDASNSSTVINGQASGTTSTKVVVNVSFPPQGNTSLRIPVFDPGNLVGHPIFGQNGLGLMSSATCFLEKSRRPTLN